MNWQQLCKDKRLADLPFKIELNRQGQIVMSPTRNRHGYYQAKIAFLLKSLLPHGEALTECAVDTTEGTIVADDVWASPERFRIIADEFSCSIAPEICVEVWSPSNTPEEIAQKCRLYLDKGALEFWYCDEQGRMSFFSQSGILPKSRFCPGFPDNVTVA
jgi:Uma2 family endonuclease